MAAAAPVAGAAAPVLPPTAFLMALQRNVNVSAACIAGVNEVLQDKTRSRMAEYFSGRVGEGLNLLLPSVLEDLAFAKDKREGLGKFVYQTPLWSLGVPDSCGYIDMHYCQIDAVPIFAKWGVCVPEQCTIEDVMTAIFPPVTKKLAERLKGKCGPLHPERTLFVYNEPWASGAIATLTLLVFLLLAVLVSTAIDVYGDKTGLPLLRDEHSPLVRVARCFSLRQNYRRLTAPPRQGPFLCLDAVRVLSMLMILLGHTMYFETNTVGVTNPREAMGFYGRGFLSTGVGLIANACLFGVDTFLALAGFLAVHLFLKELGKRLPHAVGRQRRALLVSKMAVGSYLRRYLRLTPAYAIILAVFTTLAPMLSSAPPSPTDLFHETGTCSVKWWENLLYLNNLLSTTYTMCYLPSWFLCVVQQLFLLVPWLALVAYHRPNAALALCALACLASYAYTFEMAQQQGWRLNGLDRPGFPNFFTHFYIKPFTRMPTFLIGGMGAILYDTNHWKRFQSFLTSGRWAALRVWAIVVLALGTLAVAVFGPKDEMAYAPGRWPQTSSSAFIALCWSAWTLGLTAICAVVFAGRGGPLKTLLELPFWSTLARLTYSTYLVHPMVILVVIASRGGMPAHFSLVYLFSIFIGYSAISGLAALIFYFWVEAPFGELERLLFSRAPANKKELGGEEELKKQEPVASVVVVPVSAATGPQEESTEAAQ